MESYLDKLLEVVGKRVSEIHARSIVHRAFASTGVVGRDPDDRELPRIVSRIERSLRLYLKDDDFDDTRRELAFLLPAENQQFDAQIIDIQDEGDIVTARSRAREMALALGAARVPVQKAATIVSELARNIVSYTPGGYIELTPKHAPPALKIKAVDRGTGIKRLDDILKGRYRSRTGLGMGLLGTKRLADRFEIETGEEGTKVEAEIVL